MKSIPRISDAEWEVMKVLWKKSPRTSTQVVDALSESFAWKPNTIRTLLTRLGAKGAVSGEKVGRELRYKAAIPEERCTRTESQTFLRRVYNGAMFPMIVGLLEQEKLKPEEIARLRQVLDEMEETR